MWRSIQGLAPEGCNLPQVWKLPTGSTLRSVEGALETLERRHEALRTRYEQGGEHGLIQAVWDPAPTGLNVVGADGDPDTAADAAAQRLAVRGFDLAVDRQWRACVVVVEGISNAAPICQHLPGAVLDTAVAGLLLAALTPLALEAALTVTDELAASAGQADALRAAHVQRAQHAADQARRRYLAVDPGNRLVADALEADWNARLRELATARDDYARARAATDVLDDQQRARIRALAADFPALWHDPATPMRERKRLIRLLITDVTLTRDDRTITAAVRLPGGQHRALSLPVPPNAWQQRKTPEPVIEQIGQLLGSHTYGQVARILNERGLTSGDGKPWDASRVRAHCFTRRIPSLWQRLRDAGLLTLGEAARELRAHPSSIKRWYRLGLITGHLADDRGTCLYRPGQNRPGPAQVEAVGKALGDSHRSGRSYHPSLSGPLPKNVSAAPHTEHNASNTT